MSKNRTYTKEFKQQAVGLARELNSISQASLRLGVPVANLYDWQKKLQPNAVVSPVEGALSASEREELLMLKKENAKLKQVNHILKSAAAFFSQDHLK